MASVRHHLWDGNLQTLRSSRKSSELSTISFNTGLHLQVWTASAYICAGGDLKFFWLKTVDFRLPTVFDAAKISAAS